MDVVQSHLISGEGIVWVGRPDPSRLLHRSDVAAIPFSLLWAGFSVYWEADVIAHGAPLAFTLFGAPFVLLGLYITVGRFVRQRRVKGRTWYAVTNRRVLAVVRKRSGDAVRAAFIDTLPGVSRNVRSDGSGSVVFGDASPWHTPFDGFDNDQDAPLGFYDIPDAAQAADLVEQLRQERPER